MLSFFEKLINPFPLKPVDQPPTGFLAFCWYHTREIWPYLALVSVLVAAIAIFEVMLFGFLGDIVNWFNTAERATFLADHGDQLIWMLIVIAVLLPITTTAVTLVVEQTINGNYPMLARWRSHRYLLGQSMNFYQDDFAGRIATKVMQTSISIRESVMKMVDILVYVLTYFLGIVIMLAFLDWRLSAPFLVWLAIYGVFIWYFVPRLGRVAKEQADARSWMTGQVVDAYTNITTVKLFSHAEREADYTLSGMKKFLDTVYRQMRLSTKFQIAIQILNSLLLITVGWVAVSGWVEGTIAAGAIATAVAVILRLHGMSHWIMWEMSMLFEHIGTIQDGITTLAREREVTDAAEAKPLEVPAGEIVFNNAHFNYGKEKAVIDGFDLTVKPGEKIGLIGRSGAGKSTIVNLLLRFYDLEGGQVLIDGQDIARVQQDSLRANIGMVTQDTSLLHRSVRDNILYGAPNATEEDMIAAAKQSEAHDFILELEDPNGRTGYDAHVGERGVKLSGGQRQRIAIARVLLKNAPILLLDEATSALDSEVEAAIQHSLEDLMQGKTVIAIAHRLSTVASMDKLVVMDQGRIVEQGAHNELLEAGGLYAQLWQRQTGGFLDTLPAKTEDAAE